MPKVPPNASSVNRLGDAFGAVLKEARRCAKLSQDELGHLSGYHRTYIGQLERGEKSPSLKTVFDISEVLDCAPSMLLRKTESAMAVKAET